MQKFVPHRYTITFPLAFETNTLGTVKIEAYNTTSTIVDECGLTVDDLKLIAHLDDSSTMFISTDNESSSILVFKDAVENLMQAPISLLSEQNNLFDVLGPHECASARDTIATITTAMLPRQTFPLKRMHALHQVLNCWGKKFNLPPFKIKCHVGPSARLNVGAGEYGLDDGDMYLVVGECNATIGSR